MTDTDWAGRGFGGPPAKPDPGELRLACREALQRAGRPLTLAEMGIRVCCTDRRTLIAELAAMRDDGEVRFEGPRYVLADSPAPSRWLNRRAYAADDPDNVRYHDR